MWILKFPPFKSNKQSQEIRIRETSSKLSNFRLNRVLPANSIYPYIYIPRVLKVLLHNLNSRPKPLKINNDTSIFRFSRVRGITYTHVFNPRIALGANRQSEAKRNCVRGGVYSARIHDLISLVGQSQTPTVFIEATSQQQHSRGRE